MLIRYPLRWPLPVAALFHQFAESPVSSNAPSASASLSSFTSSVFSVPSPFSSHRPTAALPAALDRPSGSLHSYWTTMVSCHVNVKNPQGRHIRSLAHETLCTRFWGSEVVLKSVPFLYFFIRAHTGFILIYFYFFIVLLQVVTKIHIELIDFQTLDSVFPCLMKFRQTFFLSHSGICFLSLQSF